MKFNQEAIAAQRRGFPAISLSMLAITLALGCASAFRGAESKAGEVWRPLPLIRNGHLDESWCHVGWGGFAVDGDSVRAECDPKGLGLLVYQKERFGNCQIRVVFKGKDAKSNSGVFVRIADGILDQVNRPGASFDRNAAGKISPASMKEMMASADREEGPWFAVHQGYEVQIMDANDSLHRTGAIYSLAASSASASKAPGEWKTMIISLSGSRIFVDLDGERVASFDSDSPNVPRDRQWFEPKREPKRPETGYIGLQNHDPGDVVWFREVSVCPIQKGDDSPTAVPESQGVSSVKFSKPADLPLQAMLPDPLVMLDGRKVTSPEMWRNERRPELIHLFQHYMFGQLPPKPPTVTGKVERVDEAAFGGKAVVSEVTLIVGPPEVPPIHLMLVVPNRRPRPAPVVLAINYFGNHTLVHDKNVRLPDNWMPERGQGVVANHATEASRGTWAEIWRIQDIIDRGYALATFYNGDVDPDTPDQRGVQKFFHHADPADDCGSIGAWAWGLQRAVDYLVTAPGIDSRRIVVTGHSRMGKAALLAAAFDERIALAIPHQAGCGGSAPSRARIAIGKSYNTLDTPQTRPPETVFNINDQFPHWFNARFKEFNNHPERLPFDQHFLVALCAPRPVLFTNGRADTWINPAGQFEVLRAAAPIYRLLAAGDFTAEELPPDGRLIDGVLGYYLRPGGHSLLREDWKVFLDFADKHLGRP